MTNTDRFLIEKTSIAGLMCLVPKLNRDQRGEFERVFCDADLASVIGHRSIRQINRSVTHERGVIRGMHFQGPPHEELKIVSCLAGEVFDVAVDLRPASPSRFHWHGVRLSAKNRKALVIPEGFAHGFQVLSGPAELLYLHTAPYEPSVEGGINALDPALAIDWPLAVTLRSPRDEGLPSLPNSSPGQSQ